MKFKNLKRYLLNIRSQLMFWIWGPDINFLKALREHEAYNCLDYLEDKGRLLDFGAGSGHQATYFQSYGFEVDAIDLETSNYLKLRDFEVTNYDGKKIPFPDKHFNIVFSSNVFEHIYETTLILDELSRVLKPNGIMVLLMPSPSWRLWTILTSIISLTRIGVHGEHAKNVFHEILVFRSSWWRQQLIHDAWNLECVNKNRLFYTGNNILGPRMSFSIRRKLSYFLGSSCNIYLMTRR